MVLELMLII